MQILNLNIYADSSCNNLKRYSEGFAEAKKKKDKDLYWFVVCKISRQ